MSKFKVGDKVAMRSFAAPKSFKSGTIINRLKSGTLLVHIYGNRGVNVFDEEGIHRTNEQWYIELEVQPCASSG